MIKKGIYKHFKGGMYEVLFVGTHSETLEEMVVYKSLKNNSIWIRPVKMWDETVEVDGEKKKRFIYIGGTNEEKNKINDN